MYSCLISSKFPFLQVTAPSLYNVGRTYLLREGEVREKAYEFFERAANMGCPYSKWELYKTKGLDNPDIDSGIMLEAVRNLQEIASNHQFLATVELCKKYLNPGFGINIGKKSVVDYFRKVKIFVFFSIRCGQTIISFKSCNLSFTTPGAQLRRGLWESSPLPFSSNG